MLENNITTSDKIKHKLHELNLHINWDLLLHIPIRYEDLTKLYKISEINCGVSGVIEGAIQSVNIIQRKTKQQLEVKITDGEDCITLLFFNFYSNYTTQFKIGKLIQAFGEVKLNYIGEKTIIHPKIKSISSFSNQQTVTDDTCGLLKDTFTPIYSCTKGITNLDITKIITKLLNQITATDIIEILPKEHIQKYNLMSMYEAIITLHQLRPEKFHTNIHIKAMERLKLDEIMVQQFVMKNIYQNKHQVGTLPIQILHQEITKFIKNLPFQLTTGQTKALQDIYKDLQSTKQMNRLLQGDVGCGKTVVMALSILPVILNSYQACILVPTEILAEQHYNKIKSFFKYINVNIAYITSSTLKSEKATIYNQIKDGTAHIIIGTHAVLEDVVIFKDLRLIIVDEQHRFGVKQRLKLHNKTNHPHQLMSSATPIPRTLAMSYYTDLDVSTIEDLPPNRRPIKSILINNNRRNEVVNFIMNKIHANSEQVYWVCPLIEESETLDLENVTSAYNYLTLALPKVRIGLIHGKLKSKDKNILMKQFLNNEIQILVATTVIEVGLDVPNATIMVIEHSERMGLAQLHQLRGRVGRGALDSTCIFLYQNPLSQLAKKRLHVITQYTDGFKIAEEDMKIRGYGEIMGDKQSGLRNLQFANLDTDTHLFSIARDILAILDESQQDLCKKYTKLWHKSSEYYLNV